MEVNEKELSTLPCPIMDVDNSIHYTIGLEVIKLGILKSFEGNPLSINKIRDKYVSLWDTYWTKNHGIPAESSTGPYWAGPRNSIPIANKILSFLNEYEIVTPLQPYNYVIETFIVSGVSCVVRQKRVHNKNRSYFTVIFKEEVGTDIDPSIDNLVKWYNVEEKYAGVIPNGILYVPILKGKIKQVSIKNVKLAKTWILNVLNSEQKIYPIAGDHCASCKSKKCREVLDVGQNEDHRLRWLRQVPNKR